MIRQVNRFLAKLSEDRTGKPGRMALLANDDTIIGAGAEDLCALGTELLERLNILAVALVEPALPFADLLITRADPDENCLVPRDTETRTFLHDIPILRHRELAQQPADQIAALLGNRKGIIVEGLGIIATGAVTPEQAYINVSSIFHSLFVKYMLDLLTQQQLDALDKELLTELKNNWLKPLTFDCSQLAGNGELQDPAEILNEISRVGRTTVELGLVDSFFGNISYRKEEIIYISQTAASLDSLEGCIDPVPFDNSSTCGITASSELLAHRRVYEQTGARALLHGHPKFAVIMSMLCDSNDCQVDDCWRDCPHVRNIGDVPIVAGEVGAGGLAERITPVISSKGRVIVFGHGVFTIGSENFRDALQLLISTEQWCRTEYFRRLQLTVDT